jgi:hypothetical protein
MPKTFREYWRTAQDVAEATKHVLAHALNQYTFQVVNGDTRREVAAITLAVKPESVETVLPSRTTVTQTVGGAFLDSFGLGLPKIRISGTTGRKSRMVTARKTLGLPVPLMMSGLEQIKFLRDAIFRQSHDPSFSAAGQPPKEDPRQEGTIYTVYFYDWQMDEVYVVNIDSLRIRRSMDRNHLYAYTIEMTVLDRFDKNDVPSTDPLFSLLKITTTPQVRGFVTKAAEVGSLLQVTDGFLEEIGRIVP